METIEEGRIDHGLGKGGQKMACLDQGIHRLVEVTHKDHGGVGVDQVPPPSKGARSHIVLHYRDAIVVLKGDPGYLIKGHHVPQTHEPYGPVGQVVEKVGNGCLATGNEDTVGTDLLVDMALASPPRPQFAYVEIVLNQGNHPGQQVPLYTILELGRLQTGGAD